mmetsp:Transcript_36704/g.56268  ORF Transcript_36704/g.56268 Transcript_36704/m.56268 type:complete len:82 (-) Transcript_36704:323-568(-)
MYAMKQLDHDDIQVEEEMRQSKLEMHSEEELDFKVESDYILLGVTGVEDLLQDNVKECIQNFMRAQIKVWMLTGDKGETAK